MFPILALKHSSLLAGFYPINHTDCLQSYLHHCFDGITGELAHAFFPPTGEIHFDDNEYWILGNMRFSWKKGLYILLQLLYFNPCMCKGNMFTSFSFDLGIYDKHYTTEMPLVTQTKHVCCLCRSVVDRPGPCGSS